MNILKKFIKEDDGMGVVEVILIIVVLVGLVLIFKNQITSIVRSIFNTISSNVSKI
ncbi:MAG: Flp1 family type IVb pilin [Butyrivibrio sp.]